jgi:hypothetical protein
MADRNPELRAELGTADGLVEWERPVLRRLQTSEARAGSKLEPCNDGVGGGCGPEENHS